MTFSEIYSCLILPAVRFILLKDRQTDRQTERQIEGNAGEKKPDKHTVLCHFHNSKILRFLGVRQ